MCKHERSQLIGTANGYVCRRCGQTFPTWAAYQAATETPTEAPAESPEAPAETPKRGRKKTSKT